MAATDAKAFPIKNQAYRVTFPILDADGDPVTGAAGLDSEVSKDGAAFADCTNEATEITGGNGVYYLELTSTEMNADTVAIVVKNTSGKHTVLVLYPLEAGDIIVNTVQWAGTATDSADIALKNTLAKGTDITGFTDLSAAQVNAECDTALADVGVTTTVTGRIDASISSRASQTSVDAIDDYVDTEVAAIKAQTDQLTFTGGKVDANADLPAAEVTAIAQEVLKLDWTTVSGEAAYSLLNAARMLRNVWNTTGGTLSVKKEDGTTNAWQRTLATDATAQPIVGAT